MKRWQLIFVYLLSGIATIAIILGFRSFPAKASVYRIASGDTLFSVSRNFNTTVDALVHANGISNPNLIIAGKTLTIPDTQVLGAASTYVPITGYQSRTTQYVTASAATIPVASTKDPAGQQIDLTNISPTSTVKVYMNLEPGTSREEAIYCTGVTTVSWTSCTRGLAFQGGSETASTTLAFVHNAGSKIIITNVGQFYNQYVSVDGAQDVWGVKTFRSLPKGSSVTTVPTTADQLATKYYVDNVGAGGFTASNVSTTRGLSVDGSAPERVGVNASSTGSLAFDSTGKLYVSPTFGADKAFIVNGTASFTGTTNLTTATVSNTPTNNGDVTPKVYVDQKIVFGQATGTAQVAITAGQALWMSATSSQIMVTNTNTASSTFQFIGIAASTTSAGQAVTYTKPGGINCNQSGLTPGLQYYLNGTAGQISTTPGTYFARIGTATTAGCLQVFEPKYVVSGSGTLANNSTAFLSTGFYPARVDMRVVYGASISNGDDTNVSVNNSPNGSGLNASKAWYMLSTGTYAASGTISKSTTGFTITSDNTANPATVSYHYIAWSE